MNEQLLIGLFTLGGAIVGGLIGGLFSVKVANIGFNKEKMEKDIRELADQVKSYWLLEKEYLSQISSLTNVSEDTIMKSTRKKVEDAGNAYPSMTANKAKSYLKEYK